MAEKPGFTEYLLGKSGDKNLANLRQFRSNLNHIFAAVALLCAALFHTGASQAQTGVAPTCPAPSLADQINSAVSPFTYSFFDAVFYEIPVGFGEDEATASLEISPDALEDGDTLKVALGDDTYFIEVDTNGAACTDGDAVVPAAVTPKAVAAQLNAALPDSVTITRDGSTIRLAAPADASPQISATGSALSVSKFSNGSLGIPFIVIWLLFGAIFFTLKMGFINFRGFFHAIQVARGTYDNPDDPGEVTHFQALTAALSGTVGLGNIAGVALAISIGGAGATFWMILAGLFGMSSKFVECTLGVHYRKIDANGVVSGGPMYYLTRGLEEKGMPGLGKALAVIFAILCIGGSFGAGNMFQVNQSAVQLVTTLAPLTGGEDSILNGRPWIIGALYAVFVGLVIVGGIRSITKVTEKLVPLMAFVYLSGAVVVIALNIGEVPSAFAEIVMGAFSTEGIAGGFVGVLVQGLRRATFSNEAGVGSAAIAHSAVKTTEPVSEGMVALLEPFIDTVVICTITALVIIVTDRHLANTGVDGITLTSSAFASVISWFPYLLTVAVALFAFSTSITWFYYGQKAFLFLVGDNQLADTLFKAIYLLVLIIGSSMTLTAVMDFADATLLAMAIPNMIGLYILAPKVKGMLDSYRARVKSGEIAPYEGP